MCQAELENKNIETRETLRLIRQFKWRKGSVARIISMQTEAKSETDKMVKKRDVAR
jgi:hypothetical protein